MDAKIFEKVFAAIKEAANQKNWILVNKLRQSIITVFGTLAQKQQVAKFIDSISSVRIAEAEAEADPTVTRFKPMDTAQLFAKYGDPDMKKKVAAGNDKVRLFGRGQDFSLMSKAKLDNPKNADPVNKPLETDDEQPSYEIDEVVETVSPDWSNATRGALELKDEYPDADYSDLVGLNDRINKSDVTAVLKEQGLID